MPIYEHQRQEWSDKIAAATEGLPLWRGGPGVDYSKARNPIAVNVTMLHDPSWEEGGPYTLDPRTTEALLAHRTTGHKMYSGVSGYADRPDVHDPLTHAARGEFGEESSMTEEDLDKLDVHLGIPFELPHHYEPEDGDPNVVGLADSKLDLLPMVAIYPGPDKPGLSPNQTEVQALRWAPLGEIKDLPDVTPDYFNQTLPHALGSLVVSHEEMSRILGVPPHHKWPEQL